MDGEGGVGELALEDVGLARRSDGVIFAPEDGGGSGDGGKDKFFVAFEHIGEGLLHVFWGAMVVGGSDEFVIEFVDESDFFEGSAELRDDFKDFSFFGRFVNAGGVEENEFFELGGFFGAEVEEDAAAVAVAESDGAVGDVFVGPSDVFLNCPDAFAGSGEAGDVEHFDGDAGFF